MVAQGPAAEFDRQVIVEYMTTGESRRAPRDDGHDRRARRTGREPGRSTRRRASAIGGALGARRSWSSSPLTSWRNPWATTCRPGAKRIRSGESGALPIIVGLIVICIFFEVQSSAFLTATNIVNLFVQATFIILLGMAELYALILSEIDLSVGFVGAVGASIAMALIGAPQNWVWWAGIIVGHDRLCCSSAPSKGTIITRLKIPSFVVTLAGLLGWQGVLIYVFDVDKGAVGGVITVSNNVIDDLVSGTMTPGGGVDPPRRAGRSLRHRRRCSAHHGGAPRGLTRASAEHHAPHRRRRRGRRRRAGVRLQPEPRQPRPRSKASPG